MFLQFCGAARTVTGSQYLLGVNGKKILLECGLFQGRRDEPEQALPLRDALRGRGHENVHFPSLGQVVTFDKEEG